ncbi:histidine phosphatase superfamily [Catenaria anguillulae PL171]|uniref:Histidine phosphatase superfamily n=1 Tax=Catenaria anguillulae PL171 TaxID=765915 RepID=A0A1Y2HRT1_9FUNG|nr:histidine phosphatase superfamily [Catenaria anguillulae PL171]
MVPSAAALPAPPTGTNVRLILCRHGETALNAKHVLQGRGVNPPLNERGQAQAQRLADRLADAPVDWIISSELQRAVDTANAVAKHHPDVPRNAYVDLAEISWGHLEGTHAPNLSPLHDAWNSGNFDYAPQDGESPNFVMQRATSQLFSILETAKDMKSKSGVVTVVIVIHGRLLRIILSTLLHRSLFMMPTMGHQNCNINVVDVILKPPSPLPPRITQLDAATLAAFSNRHLLSQLQPAEGHEKHALQLAPVPLSDVNFASSHSRVWDEDKGQVAALWPKAAVERLRAGHGLAADGMLDGQEGSDGAWFMVGTVLNECSHMAGLESMMI